MSDVLKIVVVLEGGVIQSAITKKGDAEVEVVVVDFETDGSVGLEVDGQDADVYSVNSGENDDFFNEAIAALASRHG